MFPILVFRNTNLLTNLYSLSVSAKTTVNPFAVIQPNRIHYYTVHFRVQRLKGQHFTSLEKIMDVFKINILLR